METMKDVLDEFLRPEYLNVQDADAFKAKVLEALERVVAGPSADPTPAE